MQTLLLLSTGTESEFCEGCCQTTVVANERPIEMCKSKKTMQLFQVSRRRPLCNCVNLGGVHKQLSLGNNITQERNSGCMKLTFLCFDKEFVLPQPLEDLMNMLLVDPWKRSECRVNRQKQSVQLDLAEHHQQDFRKQQGHW